MSAIFLENKQMTAGFDPETGKLISIRMKGDPLKTEYIGNRKNISYPSIREANQWMGDVRFRIWDENAEGWREERTADSEDNRIVSVEEDKVRVSWLEPSEKQRGIRTLNTEQTFQMKEDGLHWGLTVKNPLDQEIKVGEISLAFLTNTDYTGIFEDEKYQDFENWRGIKQKLWHEQRVFQHLSIDGSSSYVFCQRPKGDYPGLLFQILDGGKIETAYQMDTAIGCQWSLTFEGPYYLSLYSVAARKCEGWKEETEQQKYGMNGNSSLLLKPYEMKQFHFRFCAVGSEEERKENLVSEGQLDVDVQPSMAAPVGIPVKLRLRCKDEPRLIPVANNMQIQAVKKENNSYFYELTFTEPGQKKVRVHHGKGETILMFYATDTIRDLLVKHADFIVRRQYYRNEYDPFGRNHAFLPYDDGVEMLFTESEESWQVGALDEYALPVAMFLAEKNTLIPNPAEISVLEEYIDDCLYGKLQEKDTYYARRGLYYEDRTPSDIACGNKWDKEKAESILRSFNYPLISDIYYSMYRIAKQYGLTEKRDAKTYLEMAYRTSMTGYELGKNKFNGAPAGATIVDLVETLKEEEPQWYEKLNRKVAFIAEENAGSIYPFGSELYVDQTSHNQYEAMMRYYGKEEKLDEAYRITAALRGGRQPEWFLYGNEKRGNVCCWYGTPLNSRVLFHGFEHTGDESMLKLGYGGLLSFLTCIRSNGAAHGWYLFWPDRSGFDFRSLDTDMGMYGYLFSAKSYVVDDTVFGRCGYGCLYERKEGKEWMIPYDGLGVRFCSIPHKIRIECESGSINKICIDETNRRITVQLEECQYGTPSLRVWNDNTEEGWTIEGPDSQIRTLTTGETILNGQEGR